MNLAAEFPQSTTHFVENKAIFAQLLSGSDNNFRRNFACAGSSQRFALSSQLALCMHLLCNKTRSPLNPSTASHKLPWSIQLLPRRTLGCLQIPPVFRPSRRSKIDGLMRFKNGTTMLNTRHCNITMRS